MTQAMLRERVRQRAGNRCEYCLCSAAYSSTDYAIEHIFPQAKGGTNDEANLAWSCGGCNNRKYTATESEDPLTGLLAALYNPRLHSWQEHFSWGEDRLTLVGKTPTGRATVARLQLNRSEVVNLRQILANSDLHPPK